LPPDEFVIYLDENLCNTVALQEILLKLGVRFERHLDHAARGTPDEEWLPVVGKRGWVLLTADKNIRYNLLERRALERNAVREFVFASGNLSGGDMAAALEKALGRMRSLCRRTQPPFVAAITKAGEVHLRWPKPKRAR
jgi:PIN like domain